MAFQLFGHPMHPSSFPRQGAVLAIFALFALPAWAQTPVPPSVSADLSSRTLAAGTRYYVKRSGSDAAAGTSWDAAFQTLIKASQTAQAGDEVWVAAGAYKEDDTVTIFTGVSFYGGFAGGETDLSQRNWAANLAIIDGQNARQCVSNAGVLDGFSVTNGNAADSLGGGIYNSGSVTNCTVYNNTVSGDYAYGGGIFSSGSVTNCTVYDNTVIGNYYPGDDIYSGKGSVTDRTVYNQTFSREFSSGGGIYSEYGGSVTNCTVYNNSARGGGGIRSHSSSVTHCTIYGNMASEDFGGGISSQKSSVTHCTVYNNTAISGGGISSSFGSVTHCTVYNNTAISGGGIRASYSSVINCTVYGNTAVNGGGIYSSGSSSSITNCTVYDNTAPGNGGGIYSDNVSITNCAVYNNTAQYGGGIYSYEGSVTNCTVYGNTAQNRGGGIYSTGGSSSHSSVTNCIFWRNSPSDILGTRKVTYSCFGEGTSGEGNLRCNPLFMNTSGDPSTWDLRLRNGSPCVDAGTLSGVPATDILGSARPGGDGKVCMGAYESPDAYLPDPPPGPGMRLYVNPDGGDDLSDGASWTSALRTISRAMAIISADDDLHEIWVAQGTIRESSTIQNPTRVSLYGGFIGNEIELSQRDRAAHPTIIDGQNTRQCVFNAGVLDGFWVTNGNTTSSGGGIYSIGSVIHCTVYGNMASYNGGGIYSYSGYVANCAVYNNMADVSGGGIYSYKGLVTNCMVYGNTASYGGGIYSSGSSSSITNCTVYNNMANSYGGGIYFGYGYVTNCIAWGNTASDVYKSSYATVSYSCFKEGTTGTGNIASNPLFMNVSGDMSTWDLRLQPGSPCIDAGTSAGAPATDILGVARPQGQGFDMGAYEWIEPNRDAIIQQILARWPMTFADGDANGDGAIDTADVIYFIRLDNSMLSADTTTPKADAASVR